MGLETRRGLLPAKVRDFIRAGKEICRAPAGFVAARHQNVQAH
jgi:hypothetical protein